MVNITSQSAITKISASMEAKLTPVLKCIESNHIKNYMDISRMHIAGLLQPCMVIIRLLQCWIMIVASLASCPQPCEVVTALSEWL